MSATDGLDDLYLAAYVELVHDKHLGTESLISYVVGESIEPRLAAHIKLHTAQCVKCFRRLQIANALFLEDATQEPTLFMEAAQISAACQTAQEQAIALHKVLSQAKILKKKVVELSMPRVRIHRWESSHIDPVLDLRGTALLEFLSGVQTCTLTVGSGQFLSLSFFLNGILVEDTLRGPCDHLLITATTAIAGERYHHLPGHVLLWHEFEKGLEYEIQGAFLKEEKLVLLSLDEA